MRPSRDEVCSKQQGNFGVCSALHGLHSLGEWAGLVHCHALVAVHAVQTDQTDERELQAQSQSTRVQQGSVNHPANMCSNASFISLLDVGG